MLEHVGIEVTISTALYTLHIAFGEKESCYNHY